MTEKCRQAHNDSPLMRLRVPLSSSASGPTEIFISSEKNPIHKQNPPSCSIIPYSKMSPFDRTQMSPFENYTTPVNFPLAKGRVFRMLHPA